MVTFIRTLVTGLLVTLTVWPTAVQAQPTSADRNGVFNFADWDPFQKPTRSIDGLWAMYWEQLITPDMVLQGISAAPTTHHEPSMWHTIENPLTPGKTFPHTGYASFIMELKDLPDIPLSISSNRQPNCSKWYLINGTQIHLLFESGTVGTDEDTSVSWNPSLFTTLPKLSNEPTYLLIQLACFDYARCGLRYAPQIGARQTIERSWLISKQRSGLLIGIALIMCLYHLSLFWKRRQARDSLWFGLFSLMVFLREASTETVISQFASSEPSQLWWDLELRIEYMTMNLVCAPILLCFSHILPRQFGGNWLRWVVGLCLINTAQIVVLPIYLFTQILAWYQLCLFIYVGAGVVQIVRALVSREPYSQGLMVGVLASGAATILDVFINTFSWDMHFVAAYGVAVLILVKSNILASRFAAIHGTSELLTETLTEQSIVLQKELEHRRALEGEIDEIETRLENAHHELSRAEDLLIQAQKLSTLGELVASIGHELANPIQSMRFATSGNQEETQKLLDFVQTVFADAEGAEEAKAMVDQWATKIHEFESSQMLCSERILTITKALRKASRVDSEAIDYDLNTIVKESMTLTHGKLKRCRLETHLNHINTITCRPSHLGQVVTNLLSNAADAVSDQESAGAAIHIRTESRSHDNRAGVAVIIEDSGPGIPDELRERVLEAFFTTKPSGVGTGLGLPICSRIIAAHGGTMTIESSVELGGARVVVWLPAPGAG